VFLGMNVLTDPTTAPQIVGRTLTTNKVAEGVIDRLDLRLTPRALLKKVTISPIQQSGIVAIKAKDENPQVAANIANAFPAILIQQQTAQFHQEMAAATDRMRSQLRTSGLDAGERVAIADRLAQLESFAGAPDPTLRILSPATVPTTAYWPRPMLSVVVAILVGLILGVGAALLLEIFDPRLTDESELFDRVPILSRVPYARASVVKRYRQGGGSLPAELWEAYRTLRAGLAAQGVGEGAPKSVLVTSAMQAEGKTMTASNLAIAMAAAGHRVVLVDGDLRRSMTARVFGVEAPSEGFASLLYGEARAEDALVPSPGYGSRLRLLLSGRERPVDMLEPHRIKHLLDELKNVADVIIVDSPPVTEFADAVALADAVDLVLIAVRLGHSRRDRFDDLLRFLGRHDIVPAGYVVTARPTVFAARGRRGQLAIDERPSRGLAEVPIERAESGP
jgi:receptor protein-tyrosine kinase